MKINYKSSMPKRKSLSNPMRLTVNIDGLGMARPVQNIAKKQSEFKLHGHINSKRDKETIDFQEFQIWLIKELSYILESENQGLKTENKKNWLIGLIPDNIKKEVLLKAKMLSKEK